MTVGINREPDYLVDVSLEGNSLRASVRPRTPLPSSVEFAYYLLVNGEVQQRTPYSRDSQVDFRLSMDGRHSVKAFVRGAGVKTSRQSKHVDYKSRCEEPGAPIPELPFAKLVSPHQDTAALIVDKKRFPMANSTVEALARRVDLTMTTTEGSTAFLLHSEPLSAMKPRSVFSGTGRTSQRLVHGSADFASVDLFEVIESVGDFTLFTATEAGFEVRTDYFGVGKVYYFDAHGVSAASNRYHLLLELLSALKLPLRLNRDKMRAGFQAANQMFTQNFSASMEVMHCYCLPVGKYLRLTNAGVELKSSSITEVLDGPTNQLPRGATYDALVEAGAEDIIDNLRVALQHPLFDHVRVDLTGGLDARMIAAALSRLPNQTSQVSINTADTAASPLDLPISLRLTRELELPYDSSPRTSIRVDPQVAQLEMSSIHLGAYFGLRPEVSRVAMPGTLRINGFYGEICARPYFARLIYGMSMSKADPGDFPGIYLNAVPKRARPLSSSSALEGYLRTEFENLPGNTSTAKFEAFYLFHRNGLHCSDRWSSRGGAPAWGPLQSKALFALKWMTLDAYRDIRIQMDATEVLNEDLALLPLGRDKDNADRMALSSKYSMETPDVYSGLGIIPSDKARYERAVEQRRKNTSRAKGAALTAARDVKAARNSRTHAWALSGIQELTEEYGVFSSSEEDELSEFINSEFESATGQPGSAGTIVANKVFSAVFQCRLADAAYSVA